MEILEVALPETYGIEKVVEQRAKAEHVIGRTSYPILLFSDLEESERGIFIDILRAAYPKEHGRRIVTHEQLDRESLEILSKREKSGLLHRIYSIRDQESLKHIVKDCEASGEEYCCIPHPEVRIREEEKPVFLTVKDSKFPKKPAQDVVLEAAWTYIDLWGFWHF